MRFGRLLGERVNPVALADGLDAGLALDQDSRKSHATCGHAHAVLEALTRMVDV